MTLILTKPTTEGILVLADKRVTLGDGTIKSEDATKIFRIGSRVIGTWGRGDFGTEASYEERVPINDIFQEDILLGKKSELLLRTIAKRVSKLELEALRKEAIAHPRDRCLACTSVLGCIIAGYEKGMPRRFYQVIKVSQNEIEFSNYIEHTRWAARGALDRFILAGEDRRNNSGGVAPSVAVALDDARRGIRADLLLARNANRGDIVSSIGTTFDAMLVTPNETRILDQLIVDLSVQQPL